MLFLNKKLYLCGSLEGVAEIVLQPSNRQGSLEMNWIILILAGLCEVGFTYCLGRAKGLDGFYWWMWKGGAIIGLKL